MYFSPIKFIIGLFATLVLQHLFFMIVSGNAPPIKQPLDFTFDSKSTYNLLQLISQAPRFIGNSHYNKTINTLFKVLTELSSNSRNNISLSFSFNSGNFTAFSDNNILHFQSDIRSIVITLNHSNLTKPPLILSAHIDSHAITSGAYDDAINVALMYGIADSILKSNYPIKQPIVFIFLGSEEMGLHGSQLYMRDHPGQKGNVLNLESLGTGRPFGLIWKASKSSSVVKAFAKTHGALIATFFSDVTRLNLLKSRSDIEIYDKFGLSGAQTVFFGNPTLYHTALDQGPSIHDVEYAGELLTQFVLSFDGDENEKDVVAFGFSPFVIIIDRSLYNTIAYSAAILAITTALFLTNPISSFLWVFGCIFTVAFWYFFTGALINFVNPLSFASDIPFWFNILIISGAFAFLILECYDDMPNLKLWKAVQLIIEAVLLALICNYDISVIFIISIVLHIMLAFLPDSLPYIVNLLLSLISFVPLCFMFSFLYPIVVGYMGQVPGFKATILPIVLITFYCLYLCLSLVPISHSQSFNFGIQNKTGIQVILVLVITGIFMVVCMKPKPYSLTYPLLVSQSEYIYENLSATISMFPVSGERGINGIDSGFTYTRDISINNDFARIDTRGPAFVQFIKKVKLPKWVNEWPQFEFIDKFDSSDSYRKVTFNVLGNLTVNDFESVVLVSHCHNDHCIKSVNHFTNISYRVDDDGNNICILRFSPVCTGFSADIILDTQNKVTFDVLFTTSKITQERYRFRRFFKSFIQPYAKSYYVSDTVLFSTRSI